VVIKAYLSGQRRLALGESVTNHKARAASVQGRSTLPDTAVGQEPIEAEGVVVEGGMDIGLAVVAQ
jgi:hypothetical protein